MSEHSAPPVRSSGMLQAKPNDPPIEGDVLAKVPTSDGSEIRLVRLQDGALALGSFHSVAVGHVGGEMLREHTLPPVANGLLVGNVGDLAELVTAITAVIKTLGPPNEGGVRWQGSLSGYMGTAGGD